MAEKENEKGSKNSVNSGVVVGSIPSTSKKKRGKQNCRKYVAQKPTCNSQMSGLLHLYESQWMYLITEKELDNHHCPSYQPVYQDIDG